MTRSALPRVLPWALLLVPVLCGAPAAARDPAATAAARCGGTLLQLQVEQSDTAVFDRFRFELGLEAEAASKAEAMALLNSRLATLRMALRPLVSGELTIPAPAPTGRRWHGRRSGARARQHLRDRCGEQGQL